jgi:hypothetical protein
MPGPSLEVLRLLSHASVIHDAAAQLLDDLDRWDHDELLDTIEMHAGGLRRLVDDLRGPGALSR